MILFTDLIAQMPLDTSFKSKELLLNTINGNISYRATKDGRYSFSFFNNDTLIADLQFNQDSSLSFGFLSFNNVLIFDAYVKRTQRYSLTKCSLGAVTDSTYVEYLHEIDLENKDTSIQFESSNASKKMFHNYYHHNYTYGFIVNISDNEYVIYETNDKRVLISKTFMKRASAVSLSKDYRENLDRNNLLFVPIKKYYYKSGRKIKVIKYKDGEPKRLPD